MWVSMRSSKSSVRHSRPVSSWQFSRAQRQLLWLGVIMLLLAQCALAISLTTSPPFELISKASATPAADLQSTTEIGTGPAWTSWTSDLENKRPDPHVSILLSTK